MAVAAWGVDHSWPNFGLFNAKSCIRNNTPPGQDDSPEFCIRIGRPGPRPFVFYRVVGQSRKFLSFLFLQFLLTVRLPVLSICSPLPIRTLLNIMNVNAARISHVSKGKQLIKRRTCFCRWPSLSLRNGMFYNGHPFRWGIVRA